MSMLTRKGTMVRKPRRKTSVRRTRSAGSYTSNQNDSSVPASPIAKFHHTGSFKSSPAKSINSAVLSSEDERQFFRSSLDWSEAISASKVEREVIVQIQEANTEAENACDFLCRAHRIICSSSFMTGSLAVILILPIAMICIGVKYLNDCPIQPMIPVYLLVGGCFGLLKVTSCFWQTMQAKKEGSIDNLLEHDRRGLFSSRTNKFMGCIVSMFLIVWHVLGTFWVGSIWRPPYLQQVHDPNNWCDSTVYIFAVSEILGVFCFLCLFCLTFCLLASCFRMCGINVGTQTDL
ncbi:hypothetical protein LOTGIDRAFT_171199 [Lottia gigantea]|uniref:Uncharacterized protein n=1 Tax=Lottia gigantea TaxID=225164 RepID=V4B0L0_LOTGI|nr:hypothetical protein LOTGIDRAFT_171199 [Lottia gigantea]ESP03668.1 hypothetical protein LOTGIDRAFT_171199 [Lottia gigantea]